MCLYKLKIISPQKYSTIVIFTLDSQDGRLRIGTYIVVLLVKVSFLNTLPISKKRRCLLHTAQYYWAWSWIYFIIIPISIAYWTLLKRIRLIFFVFARLYFSIQIIVTQNHTNTRWLKCIYKYILLIFIIYIIDDILLSEI